MAAPYAEVIGDPIAQSKSPIIHRYWLGELGLTGAFHRTQVRAGELVSYFDARRSDPHWRGCSITSPHKIAVMALLDRFDASAQRVGAVNAVVLRDGALVGYNTDAGGFAEPLLRRAQRDSDHSDHLATCVQIIGAGGAARAAVAGAALAGYSNFQFFNRSGEKARELAVAFGLSEAKVGPLEALAPIGGEDGGQKYSHLLVNASSLGMGGVGTVPVDLRRYPSDTIVYDIVYAPLETSLLAQARVLGLQRIDGLEMLIGQAGVAFELFFHRPAPRQQDEMLRALLLA